MTLLESASSWLDTFDKKAYPNLSSNPPKTSLVAEWEWVAKNVTHTLENLTERSSTQPDDVDKFVKKWLKKDEKDEKVVTKICAVRILAELAGDSDRAYEVIKGIALSTQPTQPVDLRAWAAYSLIWVAAQNPDQIFKIIDTLIELLSIEKPTAVRERATRALRVICVKACHQKPLDDESTPDQFDTLRIRIKPETFRRIAQALWESWKNEYDWTVAEHLVIAWGHSAGYLLPNEKSGDNPLIDFLEKALNHDFRFVADRVPDAVRQIISTILKAPNWTTNDCEGRKSALRGIEKTLGKALTKKLATPQNTVPEAQNLVSPDWEVEYKRELILCVREIAATALELYNTAIAKTPRPTSDLSNFYKACAEDAITFLHTIAIAANARDLPLKSRKRAILALKEIALNTSQAGTALIQNCLKGSLEKLVEDLNDKNDEIALVATDALSAIYKSSDGSASEVASTYADYILKLSSGSNTAVFRDNEIKCRRWATAIARSVGNDRAIDKLVAAMKSKKSEETAQVAESALGIISSQKVIQQLKNYMDNLIRDRFYKPLEEFQTEGINVLKEVRSNGNNLFWIVVIVSLIVVLLGILLTFGSIVFFLRNAKDPVQAQAWVGVISGLIAAIIGALIPFFWNSLSNMGKTYGDVSRSISGLLGFILRTRLLGLGFSYAYTEGNWDKKDFFIDAANAAGQATRDTAYAFAEVGKLDLRVPDDTQTKSSVQVPKDLKGMPAMEAAKTLNELGLRFDTEEEITTQDNLIGQVIDWKCPEGFQVKPLSKIRLVVAKKA